MVAAHETCHQWWFGKVANDQALHPWMDESLATYCEILFYENYYPELVDWWWFTRVNFYEPTGFIDQDIYTYQGFTPYTNATYRQGARFLEELRTLMGDEAFFAFMRQYSDELKNKVATPQDFFRILRENTSADLEGLISTYFQGTY
jgi:aminopeptidase N